MCWINCRHRPYCIVKQKLSCCYIGHTMWRKDEVDNVDDVENYKSVVNAPSYWVNDTVGFATLREAKLVCRANTCCPLPVMHSTFPQVNYHFGKLLWIKQKFCYLTQHQTIWIIFSESASHMFRPANNRKGSRGSLLVLHRARIHMLAAPSNEVPAVKILAQLSRSLRRG